MFLFMLLKTAINKLIQIGMRVTVGSVVETIHRSHTSSVDMHEYWATLRDKNTSCIQKIIYIIP